MRVRYGSGTINEEKYRRFIKPITPGSKRSMVTKVVGSTSDRSRSPGMSIVARESDERWVLTEGRVLPNGMRGRPSDKWRRSNPKGSQRLSRSGGIETIRSITR